MSRFTAVLAALLLVTGSVFAQPKAKEPTPTLDSLDGPSKAAVVKAAKNVYKLPDGSLLDMTFFARYLEVERKYWSVSVQGLKSNRGGFVEKKITGKNVSQNPTPESKAFGIPNSQGEDKLTRWKDGKEFDNKNISYAAETGYFKAIQQTKDEDIPVAEKAADYGDGYYGCSFAFAYPKPIAAYGKYPVTRIVCQVSDDALKGDRFVGEEFFALAVEQTDDKGRITRVRKPIQGNNMDVWKVYTAASLRVTPEQLATACLANEIELRNHSWKKSATDEAVWSHTPIVIKTKPSREAPPVEPTAPAESDEK